MYKIKEQSIILPWETKLWPTLLEKVSRNFNTITAFDMHIVSIYTEMKHGIIKQLFEQYYLDEHSLSDDFIIGELFPYMQKLVIDAPKTLRQLPRHPLSSRATCNITLTRRQITTVLACVWFGMFNYKYISRGKYREDAYPDLTFINIFVHNKLFALQCILNYFHRTYELRGNENYDRGIIILKKNILEPIDWINCTESIADVFIGEGRYNDDSPAQMHVVNAHDIIGLNLFTTNTQEELTLAIRPELLIGLLYCGKLNDNETLTIMGAEKISAYEGVSTNVRFIGPHVENLKIGTLGEERIMQIAHVFMDAHPTAAGYGQCVQFFDRDLNKAYCGFASLPGRRQVSTANWSCEPIGSHMQVKFIQQLLAASAAGKVLIYHSPVPDMEDKIDAFCEHIEHTNMDVGMLYANYMMIMESKENTYYANIDIINEIINYEP